MTAEVDSRELPDKDTSDTDEKPKKPPREWPFHLKLASPLNLKGVMTTDLTFREGTLGDLASIDLQTGRVPMNDLILVAARLSEQTTAVIRKLSPADAKEAVGCALDFIASTLPDG